MENLIRNFSKNSELEVIVFDKCIHNTITYHTVKYIRVTKTNDSVIELSCGKVMQIFYVVKAGNECFICGHEWVISKNQFNGTRNLPLLNHIFEIKNKRSRPDVHNINNLKRKVIVIDIGNQVYGSFPPNSYKSQ